MNPTSILKNLFVWLLLMCLLPACCDTEEQSQKVPSEVDSANGKGTSPSEDVKQLLILAERRQVCEAEFNCERNDFLAHFKARMGAGDIDFDPDNARQILKWNALSALRATYTGNSEIGVKVHYGLRTQGPDPVLEWALELVELNPAGPMSYSVVEVDPIQVHIVTPNGGLTSTSRVNWQSGSAQNYLNRILVQHYINGPFLNLTEGRDTDGYILKWADIAAVHQQNGAPALLRLTAIAAPLARFELSAGNYYEHDWRHSVAISAYSGSDDLLNNDELADPQSYANRALDLGSPCPPACDPAVFLEIGLKARQGCNCPIP